MYIYSGNLLPECFDNLFISHNQVHDHNTGAATKYRSHACRANIIHYPTSSSENIELTSFVNNRNKYHFLFQTKIAKIFH
jgi:hypothetical protein